MKAAKSGCGSRGLDLNSGWNWQPRNQGWFGRFDDFHVLAVGSAAGDAEAGVGQSFFVFAIEFVAMAVALADFGFAIGFEGEGAGLELAGPRAEAHGAAHFVHAEEFAQFVDHAMRAFADRTRCCRPA